MEWRGRREGIRGGRSTNHLPTDQRPQCQGSGRWERIDNPPYWRRLANFKEFFVWTWKGLGAEWVWKCRKMAGRGRAPWRVEFLKKVSNCAPPNVSTEMLKNGIRMQILLFTAVLQRKCLPFCVVFCRRPIGSRPSDLHLLRAFVGVSNQLAQKVPFRHSEIEGNLAWPWVGLSAMCQPPPSPCPHSQLTAAARTNRPLPLPLRSATGPPTRC